MKLQSTFPAASALATSSSVEDGRSAGSPASSLERDYDILTYLIEHAAGLELESIEDRLLVWDYKVMQGWYRLTRTAAPQQAREALAEMASVLGILAAKIGEHAGVQTQA